MAAIRLDALTLWEDNYNHGDVLAIANSIRRTGFNSTPRLWEGGVVMAGNHSVAALRLIQAEGPRPKTDQQYPPANVTLDADGGWMIDYVSIGHLTHEEAVAFAIADNELARKAVSDGALLVRYLRDLPEDLVSITGFDEASIEALEASLEGLDDGDDLDALDLDTEEQDVPEQYLVVVECTDESAQAQLIERLMGEGYVCRSLLS